MFFARSITDTVKQNHGNPPTKKKSNQIDSTNSQMTPHRFYHFPFRLAVFDFLLILNLKKSVEWNSKNVMVTKGHTHTMK